MPNASTLNREVTRSLTFALEALAEEASQELLAVLADGRTRVVVHDKGVRHFDATGVLLFHPQRPSSAPRLRPTVATALRPTAVAWQRQQRHLGDRHRARYTSDRLKNLKHPIKVNKFLSSIQNLLNKCTIVILRV